MTANPQAAHGEKCRVAISVLTRLENRCLPTATQPLRLLAWGAGKGEQNRARHRVSLPRLRRLRS
jgi:hypothetical protein